MIKCNFVLFSSYWKIDFVIFSQPSFIAMYLLLSTVSKIFSLVGVSVKLVFIYTVG